MVALVLLLVLAAAGYWLYTVFSKPAQATKKRAVQEITLQKPPPPPPPPKTPPPPPPPKQEQEKVEVPKPDEAQPDKPADAPPPGPDLAVDAAGSGSGDGFGLVGKPGGTDLLATGTGGGGGGTGNRFAWYGALVKERIQDAVLKDKKLRSAADYQRQVNVWVNNAGAVTRVELIGPGESPELDDALRQVLRNVAAVREGAPTDMPQPIKLRISARS